MTIPTLTTERLLLRPFSAADAGPLQQILSDKVVLRYMPTTEPPDRRRVGRLIEQQLGHWAEHQFGWWAVERRAEPGLIGWCGLTHLPETGQDEVAYLFGRAYWGRGYASEAARASLEFGFAQRDLKQIIGLTHPENVASQNVLKKLGLTFVDQICCFGMTCRRYSIEAEEFEFELGV